MSPFFVFTGWNRPLRKNLICLYYKWAICQFTSQHFITSITAATKNAATNYLRCKTVLFNTITKQLNCEKRNKKASVEINENCRNSITLKCVYSCVCMYIKKKTLKACPRKRLTEGCWKCSGKLGDAGCSRLASSRLTVFVEVSGAMLLLLQYILILTFSIFVKLPTVAVAVAVIV